MANQARVLPQSVADLTPESKEEYLADMHAFTYLIREFNQHETNLLKLQDWVINSVSNTFRRTCCLEDTTLDQWYLAFQQTGSAYERTQKGDARTRYQNTIKPLTKNSFQSFDNWITE